MTDHAEDTRIIDPDAPVYNATLVRREDQSDDLGSFWVRLDGDPVAFVPGQYLTIGVVVDGKLLQRPYSVASAPQDGGTTSAGPPTGTDAGARRARRREISCRSGRLLMG